MASVLESLASEGLSLSALRSRIPSYAMVREKLACRARDIAPALRALRRAYRQETLDFTDGVKVLWPDRWLHVRGSNTEPVLRLTAEAPLEADARVLLGGALEHLRGR
jgi:phosphomannomutase